MTDSTSSFKRRDGRELLQLRPISLTVGEVAGAGGSAKYRSGSNCVLALLYGPSSAKAASERYDQTVIQVSVQRTTNSNSVLAASVNSPATRMLTINERRKQQIEENRIAAMIRRVLMSTVIDVAKFPRTVISISVQILQEEEDITISTNDNKNYASSSSSSSSSLETCCFNAVMAAVLNSSIPCKMTVAAVNSGIITQNSSTKPEPILDLTKQEERFQQQQNSEQEQQQQQTFLLHSKGTFVVSNENGIVATSDLVFFDNNNVDTLQMMNKMEKAANAAATRMFEIFKESLCGRSGTSGEEATKQD